MSDLLNTPSLPASSPSDATEGLQDKHTIYVLVRTDISLEQQAVQAAHAAAEAARDHYRPEHGIASIILLAVKDHADLHRARTKLHQRGIEHTLFHEPDFGMGDSALATRPLTSQERKLMRSWQLLRAKPHRALSA